MINIDEITTKVIKAIYGHEPSLAHRAVCYRAELHDEIEEIIRAALDPIGKHLCHICMQPVTAQLQDPGPWVYVVHRDASGTICPASNKEVK